MMNIKNIQRFKTFILIVVFISVSLFAQVLSVDGAASVPY